MCRGRRQVLGGGGIARGWQGSAEVGRHGPVFCRILKGSVGVARGRQVSGCVGGCHGGRCDDRALFNLVKNEMLSNAFFKSINTHFLYSLLSVAVVISSIIFITSEL